MKPLITNEWFLSVVVITCPLHGQGREFDPHRNHVMFRFCQFLFVSVLNQNVILFILVGRAGSGGAMWNVFLDYPLKCAIEGGRLDWRRNWKLTTPSIKRGREADCGILYPTSANELSNIFSLLSSLLGRLCCSLNSIRELSTPPPHSCMSPTYRWSGRETIA